MKEPDKEVQELVNSLIKSARKTILDKTATDTVADDESTDGEDPTDS